MPTAKCTLDIMGSASGQHSDKSCWIGDSSNTTTGKWHLVDRKVEGIIEDIYYSKEIRKVMSSEQKVHVLSLLKTKSTMHAEKATNTSGSGPNQMDVSSQLALTHAVPLDFNCEYECRLSSHHARSCQCGSCSPEWSSSHSHGSHQSGVHKGHWRCWQLRPLVGLGLGFYGTQPRGAGVLLDATQYSSGRGAHWLVCIIRTVNLSSAVGSTRS